MRNFKLLVDTARKQGISEQDGTFIEGSPRRFAMYAPASASVMRGFFNAAEDCQPFVFHDVLNPVKTVLNPQEVIEYDAPFKVFSIEPLSGGWRIGEKSVGHLDLGCVMSEEVSPKVFRHFILAFIDGAPRVMRFTDASFVGQLVRQTLRGLYGGAIGVETTREKIKLEGSEKPYRIVRRVVHIEPSRTRLEASVSQDSGRRIEWSHRWLVRGHWRKTEGLGKDRAGDYCVYGNTWVVPYEKGDASKPLIAKTRVVGNSTQTNHNLN